MVSNFLGGFALAAATLTLIGAIDDRVDHKHAEIVISILLLVAVVGFK